MAQHHRPSAKRDNDPHDQKATRTACSLHRTGHHVAFVLPSPQESDQPRDDEDKEDRIDRRAIASSVMFDGECLVCGLGVLMGLHFAVEPGRPGAGAMFTTQSGEEVLRQGEVETQPVRSGLSAPSSESKSWLRLYGWRSHLQDLEQVIVIPAGLQTFGFDADFHTLLLS